MKENKIAKDKWNKMLSNRCLAPIDAKMCVRAYGLRFDGDFDHRRHTLLVRYWFVNGIAVEKIAIGSITVNTLHETQIEKKRKLTWNEEIWTESKRKYPSSSYQAYKA